MYRALYAFENDADNVLPCKAGDRFTVLENENAHWWLVQNGRGQLGYIPASYLALDEGGHSEVLLSIDNAIQSAQQQLTTSTSKSAIKQLNDALDKLLSHRSAVVAERNKSTSSTKRRAPVAPEPRGTRALPHSLDSKEAPEFTKKEAPRPPIISDANPITVTSSAQLAPVGLGLEMVENVRHYTGLSYANSRIAVASILKLLGERVQSTQSIVNNILKSLTDGSDNDGSQCESSDAVQLRKIFQQLESVKDDSQQRSWFLHEDEGVICKHLEDLISILSGANPAVSRSVFTATGYTVCHNLALYYQMETRLSIRLLLLQVFCAMCSLDEKIVFELLNSVLPLELARDIQADLTDIQKVEYSALVLTMVFSTGEAVPLQYYEHLDGKFLGMLLDIVETPLAQDLTEELPDMFVKLILSFNQHFELPEENIVMKTLAERGTAKTFTEKLLLLFNREDDPTHMFEYHSTKTNSVIKFLSDLYSCRQTANLLYTNDAKVLIDIIVRQLSDLSPGDRMRTDYLSLIHLLLSNSDYADHLHRQSELSSCFVRMVNEDREGVEMDQDIVKQIWKQFPELFHSAD